MATRTKHPTAELNEVRVDFPPQLMKLFQKEPRVVLKYRPDGIWPVDPVMLQEIEWSELARSRNFTKNFEVFITPKM
jgi:hypothetical protein